MREDMQDLDAKGAIARSRRNRCERWSSQTMNEWGRQWMDDRGRMPKRMEDQDGGGSRSRSAREREGKGKSGEGTRRPKTRTDTWTSAQERKVPETWSKKSEAVGTEAGARRENASTVV